MGKIIYSCLALFFVIIFWSFATPIFELPDEQAHIASVNYLINHGELPQDKDRRLSKQFNTQIVTPDLSYEIAQTEKYLGIFRDQYGNNKVTYHPEYRPEYAGGLIGKYESDIISLNSQSNRQTYVGEEAARYPRLYYDYLSAWHRLVSSGDIILRSFVLRIGNVALAVLTAFIIFESGLLIFTKKSHALTLTLLVLLQPMYSFLSSGVNSDNLHNLLFALVIYYGIRIIREGLTPRNMLATTLVVALDIITKPQGYIALPLVGIAILISIIQTKKWRLLIALITVGFISLLAIYSPWNPYKSWINPTNLHNASLVEFARFSVNKLVAQNIVWYWGVFKWLGVVLPPIYWQVANRIVLISGLGLIVYLWRILKKKKVIALPTTTIFLLLSVIIYTLAIYYFDWQYTKAVGYSIGVQARYLFPTISAQMALLITGIISFGWNAKSRIWLRYGLILFIIWMQLGGLYRLLSSYYDLSSVSTFITQASQYKPWFAKGNWWYLWGGLYIASLLYLVRIGLKTKSSTK